MSEVKLIFSFNWKNIVDNNTTNNSSNNYVVTWAGAVKFSACRVSDGIQSGSRNVSALVNSEIIQTVGTLMRQLETSTEMRKIFIVDLFHTFTYWLGR